MGNILLLTQAADLPVKQDEFSIFHGQQRIGACIFSPRPMSSIFDRFPPFDMHRFNGPVDFYDCKPAGRISSVALGLAVDIR